MRAPDKRLIVSLSISAVIAVAAFAAATSTSQAQRMGNFSMGSRGGSMTGGGGMRMQPSLRTQPRIQPTFRAEPRFQQFNNTKIVGDGVKGRGKGRQRHRRFNQQPERRRGLSRPPPAQAATRSRSECRGGHWNGRRDRHRRRHRHTRPNRPGHVRPAASVGRYARAAQCDQHSARQREPLRQGRGGAGVRQQFSADPAFCNFWRGTG